MLAGSATKAKTSLGGRRMITLFSNRIGAISLGRRDMVAIMGHRVPREELPSRWIRTLWGA
jgi:hypothetical protein